MGSTVRSFEVVDAWYVPRVWEELSASAAAGERATVVVFTTLSCPIANRYLPLLAELEREYRDRGVRFLAVNVGPSDTLAQIAGRGALAGIDFPLVKDFTGGAVAALGATRTPEAVVVDDGDVIRFRGRIDDRVRFGGQAQEAASEPLRDALDAVLAGTAVAVPETVVEGCLITLRRVEPSDRLTWVDHLAPLFRESCQTCHRPGGKAPFALTEWRDVADRAAMIAEVVEQQRMPPWFASPDDSNPAGGGLAHAGVLAPDERDAIVSWARAGAPRGDGEPIVDPLPFDDGWTIEPDLVLEAARATTVPAAGVLPYQYVWIEHLFAEDTWVEAVQVRPSRPGVLHHALVMAEDGPIDVGDETTGQYVHIYVPGGSPLDLEPGTARRIPAGSSLRLQLHYEPLGVEVTDRVQVGLRFPRAPVRKRLRTVDLRNTSFEIPPGEPAHAVEGQRRIPFPITARGAMPHMHARGKDMVLWYEDEEGVRENLLVVGNFDFDWQREYHWPPGAVRIPAGATLRARGRFDNSALNPYNPDPGATVTFGRDTRDEMMYCWLFFTKDAEQLFIKVDPRTGQRLRIGTRRDGRADPDRRGDNGR